MVFDIHSEIWPRRRQLLTRHSKWCRGCDKLLIKPDLIAAKIEFKRQHVALYIPSLHAIGFKLIFLSVSSVASNRFYVPRMTLASLPSFYFNQSTQVTLVVTNPVSSLMHISINQLAPDTTSQTQTPTVRKYTHNVQLNENETFFPSPPSMQIQPSSVSTFIGVSDEYDDLWETEEYKKLKSDEESDKDTAVVARHLNKVHIVFNILPAAEQAELKVQVSTSFPCWLGISPSVAHSVCFNCQSELQHNNRRSARTGSSCSFQSRSCQDY